MRCVVTLRDSIGTLAEDAVMQHPARLLQIR
jgi:hypothetical protein